MAIGKDYLIHPKTNSSDISTIKPINQVKQIDKQNKKKNRVKYYRKGLKLFNKTFSSNFLDKQSKNISPLKSSTQLKFYFNPKKYKDDDNKISSFLGKMKKTSFKEVGNSLFKGRYSIIEEEIQIANLLGQGSYSSVYQCYDIKLQKRAAVKMIKKMIPDSQKQKDRIINEIFVYMNLDHPNIVQFNRYFETHEYVIYNYLFLGLHYHGKLSRNHT